MEANSTARRAHHERGLDLAMAMSSLPSLTTYKEAQARAAQESHAHAPAPDVEEAEDEDEARDAQVVESLSAPVQGFAEDSHKLPQSTRRVHSTLIDAPVPHVRPTQMCICTDSGGLRV